MYVYNYELYIVWYHRVHYNFPLFCIFFSNDGKFDFHYFKDIYLFAQS